MQIKGRHVLLTGASRGIGLAIAENLAAKGAHLHLVARSWDANPKNLPGAASMHTISADLATSAGVNHTIDSIKGINIDLLINNAGLLTGGLLEEQDPKAIRSMLAVNLEALIILTQALLPGMLKRGQGKIVNNASVSGKMFFPCASTYAASKAGVVAFTESLKQELRGTGVNTLLLVTSGVKTEMFDDISKQYGGHLKLDFLNSIPALDWANRVIEAIEKDQDHCWPTGSSRFGVWMGHHFPETFEKLIQGKFSRKGFKI